ncbi:MAG TPA: pyridoxal phosphate-dependent aminotransferase [Jiangellaceae bacterium]|nr:pyridoxal phosphate-dependent aminotransferase [Jiangellaceae bacterium]
MLVTHSATLAANERIQARMRAGVDVLHLAFGEAGLPVHPELADVLARSAHRTGYPPVIGDEHARAAVAGYFARRGVQAEKDQVVLAPGSKALLLALLYALPGDVVLPQPSWVSYAAQAALLGRRTLPVPIPEHTGGVPDPQLLATTLDDAKRAGRHPGVLLVTRPDNPTGAVAPDADLKAVCDVAAEHDLTVISDEIYGDLAYGLEAEAYPTSPATLIPERTIVTTGLSKRLALGGWRIGAALVPPGEPGTSLVANLTAVGSEIWSSMAAPMQDVTAYAFDEPPEMQRYIAQARHLHGAVATAMWRTWVEAGANCREPQGGFYCYPDLTAHAGRVAAAGATTSAELSELLLARYNVGVLPGTAFGDAPDRLAMRVATSLLYGRTVDERQAALDSEHPADLPWIKHSMDRMRDALDDLLGPRPVAHDHKRTSAT